MRHVNKKESRFTFRFRKKVREMCKRFCDVCQYLIIFERILNVGFIYVVFLRITVHQI